MDSNQFGPGVQQTCKGEACEQYGCTTTLANKKAGAAIATPVYVAGDNE
jgi:hypothetical protein